jgi:hypothetical protein
MLYDLVLYHALLRYVYKIEDIGEARNRGIK